MRKRNPQNVDILGPGKSELDTDESDKEELKITLKPYVTKIINTISNYKGIDSQELVYSYIRKGINKDWNFKGKKPRDRCDE